MGGVSHDVGINKALPGVPGLPSLWRTQQNGSAGKAQTSKELIAPCEAAGAIAEALGESL